MLNMKEIADYGPCYVLAVHCPANGVKRFVHRGSSARTWRQHWGIVIRKMCFLDMLIPKIKGGRKSRPPLENRL